MTTIAVRDGVMAADSMLTTGGSAAGRVSKIERMPDGCIVGGTGACGEVAAFRQWWRGGANPDKKPKLSASFTGIIMRPSGSVELCDDTLVPYRVEGEFHAVGSGWEFAMGAMAMGALASEAVAVACRFDQGSAEPIRVEGV